MKTVTIAMRLPKAEAERLAGLARDMDLERSAFYKRALKRGAADLMFEQACAAYRDGQATLSKAASMAGLSLRDMLARLNGANLELTYDTADLAKDLRP